MPTRRIDIMADSPRNDDQDSSNENVEILSSTIQAIADALGLDSQVDASVLCNQIRGLLPRLTFEEEITENESETLRNPGPSSQTQGTAPQTISTPVLTRSEIRHASLSNLGTLSPILEESRILDPNSDLGAKRMSSTPYPGQFNFAELTRERQAESLAVHPSQQNADGFVKNVTNNTAFPSREGVPVIPTPPRNYSAPGSGGPTMPASSFAQPMYNNSFQSAINPNYRVQGANPSRLVTSGLTNIVSKWNLKYGGKQHGSAEDFFDRLEDWADFEGLSLNDLTPIMATVFEGLPRQWYRTHRGSWSNWEEFRTAFLSRFGTKDLQPRLQDYLYRRTQAEGESAADYITCLEGIAARLERPIHPQELLDLAFRNLRPDYRLQIDRESIHTLDGLVSKATDREVLWASCKPGAGLEAPVAELAPPNERKLSRSGKATPVSAIGSTPTKTSSSSTSTATTAKKKATTREETSKTTEKGSSKPSDSQDAAKSNPNVECWNCHKKGHTLYKCPEPLKKDHCYKCERNGSIIPECPRCTGKGNGE